MLSAHSGQGQQLCSFFSDMAVRLSRATCGKAGLVEALVLNLGSEAGSCGLLGGQSVSGGHVWFRSTLSQAG